MDHPTTCLENRSTTTPRLSQPSWIRMELMSVTHDWVGFVHSELTLQVLWRDHCRLAN